MPGLRHAWFRTTVQLLLAALLLCGPLAANAIDTYDPTTNTLTIPALTINGTAYTNVRMTLGSVVSVGGGSPSGTSDTYSTSTNQLTIPSVLLGTTTYTNVVATVGTIISIGNASSAPNGGDTYDPATNVLTIPLVIVGNSAYTNLKITVGNVVSVGGGTPASAYDTYLPGTNQLTIPAVLVGSTTYTNVVVTVGNVISVGGATVLPQAAPLLALINPLAAATVGQAYSRNVVAGVWPTSLYTFMLDTLANGVLPSSMTLHIDGTLSGTPTATGKTDINGNQLPNTYTFGVCAVDTFSRSVTTPCPQASVTVNPAPVTYSGSFSGSGSFSRPFPDWGTTCTFSNTYSGTMTVATSVQNGVTTGTAQITGTWVSNAVSGGTSLFTCLNSSTALNDSPPVTISGTAISWTTAFTTLGGSVSTGKFTGTISPTAVSGTMVETIDTSTGSATVPVNLTKR